MKLALGLVLVLLAVSQALAVEFAICKGSSGRAACVYDGDTFWFEHEKFRTLGYDSPELGWPFCDKPAAGAKASRDRLRALLNSGGFNIERQAIDRYGRTLAWVTIGGESLAKIMIREGYGRPWIEGGEHWC